MSNLNEHQKRALELLDKLIYRERQAPRIANDSAYLTTSTQKPDAMKMPAEWSQDWCKGWAFELGYHFALPLAITLDKFVKDKKSFLKWVQRTTFNFREGYIIHSYGDKYQDSKWQTQIEVNPYSYQVVRANPARPYQHGVTAKPARVVKTQNGWIVHEPVPYSAPQARDCGYVEMQILDRELGFEASEIKTLTQDDFVRFLIIGRSFLKCTAKAMDKTEMKFVIKGDKGEYNLYISCQPKPEMSCDCPGARSGIACKHMREILRRDFHRIENFTNDQRAQLVAILDSKEMDFVVESQAEQIDWLEKEQERIKAEIKKRKHELAQTLNR